MCNHCGAKRKIALNERTYQCPICGYIENRDTNAAKNIRDEGIRLHRN
ncbi:transposase [[Clostridium] innocuum]|nr:transposase [[Clostridium] innocuum]MCR0443849.1 transposase [[Clostridium] innocuum]